MIDLSGIGKPRPERKPRSGIMLCYPYESKRLARWNSPSVYVQPKLDGERARLLWDPALGWTFMSSTQELINFAVPHLVESIEHSKIPHNTHFDGELYCHGLDFESIHSMVSRRVELHPEHASISYHIFDLCIEDAPQWTRFMRLEQLRNRLPPEGFNLVATKVALDETDIWELNDKFVSEGFEGIIVRNYRGLWVPKRSTDIMKFKPKQSDVYKVIGAEQLIRQSGQAAPLLGALICECDGQIFRVGTGFTQAERVVLWNSYLSNPTVFEDGSLAVRVKYQHITSGSRVPRFPVFAELCTADESEAEAEGEAFEEEDEE